MSFCISSIYQEARVPRWTTTAASILDTFKFDVALIASIVTCPEHASIGAHLPWDLVRTWSLGLAFRDALPLPPPTCSRATFATPRCVPCLCATGLMVHAEAQGSPSPIDATLVVDVLTLSFLSIRRAHVPLDTLDHCFS